MRDVWFSVSLTCPYDIIYTGDTKVNQSLLICLCRKTMTGKKELLTGWFPALPVHVCTIHLKVLKPWSWSVGVSEHSHLAYQLLFRGLLASQLKLGLHDGARESQHNTTHLKPFFVQFSDKEKGQRASFWQFFHWLVLAGAGRKDLEQRYQGNAGSRRRGPGGV